MLIFTFVAPVDSAYSWQPKAAFYELVRKDGRPFVSADKIENSWSLVGLQMVPIAIDNLEKKARRLERLVKLKPLIGTITKEHASGQIEIWQVAGSILNTGYSSKLRAVFLDKKIEIEVLEGDFVGTQVVFDFEPGPLVNAANQEAWVRASAKINERDLPFSRWLPDIILRLGFEGAMDIAARRLKLDVLN